MSEEYQSPDAGREHLEELTTAYVLGALHDDEAGLREFETLVESGDPSLAKSLEHMLEASVALAAAAPQTEPPASVRASLLSSIEKLNTASGGKNPQARYDNAPTPVSSQDALR